MIINVIIGFNLKLLLLNVVINLKESKVVGLKPKATSSLREETAEEDYQLGPDIPFDLSKRLGKRNTSDDRNSQRLSSSLGNDDYYKAQLSLFNEEIEVSPFMAYVRVRLTNKNLNCGGTIITSMHILTAAKCLYDNNKKQWAKRNMVDIHVGLTFPFRGRTHKAFAIYPNKDYPTTLNIDVGVIELRNELKFSPYINTIRLAGPTQSSIVHELIHVHTRMLVMAWGNEKDHKVIHIARQDSDNKNKSKLKLDPIRLLSHYTYFKPFKECRSRIKGYDQHTMLCAKRDSLQSIQLCPGSRGGPVIWRQQQFAIVSRGTCLETKRIYYIFSRVDALRGYIDDTLFRSGRYKGRKLIDNGASLPFTNLLLVRTLILVFLEQCIYFKITTIN